MADGAGNIPTGNGTPFKHNHFIVMPQELAERYQHVLNNPVEEEALRGDLTAMLAYQKPIYMFGKTAHQLNDKVSQETKHLNSNERRREINLNMLLTDAKKFNFRPSLDLIENGQNTDVKRELYRYPSILMLDMAINCQATEVSSWNSSELLEKKSIIPKDIVSTLQKTLSIATYIRLSSYLYHDSQDDRMSVGQRSTKAKKDSQNSKSASVNFSQRRWHISTRLFSQMSESMIPLKTCIAQSEITSVEDLGKIHVDSDH